MLGPFYPGENSTGTHWLKGLAGHLNLPGSFEEEQIILPLKGKAVPLQAWSNPEGSRKLRFPDLMTMAQDGGKVVSLTHRPPLLPENTPGTHFY
jgi:hypothetical protein